ncbi:TonB-dependent receptor [Sphingomonas sp. SUN019]|uniref:TonB-dependent receptor n=1 Tax=Sphingomonas sp. SUN019 TaxID=2937788 RepID=UPI002164243F|nr:TonB-dependent receptor [Sphingomonas sp. SUN019]UVO50692.1 TonB-dependent receptor [Sphingomonas sp. SUN019]
MVKGSAFHASRNVLLAATMLAPWFATPALAQSAAGPADAADQPATDAQPAGIGDVIVTARKTGERLQDVPLTITALTAETLEKTDTKTIFDLATRTPGLYFGTTGGRNGGNKLQIRNLSTGTSGGSKASVFIDGVFMSGDYSSTALANLERIEVLKGPQSAYFGRSTFVGAVNFVTKDPGDVFAGKIDAITATDGEYDISGYLTTPIVKGVLSNTIAARYFEYGGPDAWVNRDGYHFGDQKTVAVTNKLVFTPTDWLKIRWYGSYVHDRDAIPQTSYAPINTRNSRIVRPDGTVSYYYKGSVNIDHSRANAPNLYQQFIKGYITDPGVTRNQYRSVFSFDADLGGSSLSGFAAYSDEKLANRFDASYLGARAGVIAPNAADVPTAYSFNASNFASFVRTKDQQYELRLTAPQDQRLRYTFGYNYTKIYGSTRALFDPVTPAGLKVNAAPIVVTNNRNTVLTNPSQTHGIFGGLYFDVTDQLTISAELRQQWDKISLTQLPTAFAPTPNPAFLEASFKATLPRLNIQYKVNDDLQFYAIYSVGNNPGGFNANVPTSFPLPTGVDRAFGEEKLYNYEGGLKSTWLDGRLIFNAAVYHMNWKNQQVPQATLTNFPQPGATTVFTTASSRSTVTGFEAELEALPAEGLNLRATASYGKAKYKELCSTNYFALTGIATGFGCRSVAGFQQEGTPALQLSLFADYDFPLTDTVNGYIRADYQHQSKIYLDEWNDAWMGAANLAGLRIGVQTGRITVEGFVRNLLNDDHSARTTRVSFTGVGGTSCAVGAVCPVGSYPTITTPLGTFPAGAAGNQSFADTARRPRQVGVRLGYKF